MKELCNLYKMVFSIVIIVLTAFFVCPLLFGYTAYAIETNSMEPTIPTGSIVYIEKTSSQDLKLNDIITFERANKIITHRVVGIDDMNNQLTTKGDAIKYNDEEKISVTHVKGEVKYSIPLIGYGLMFLKSIEGTIMSIILIILYIISIVFPRKVGGHLYHENNK
ncbi:MAG: signal peptidase I [Coprobacillus sp.]